MKKGKVFGKGQIAVGVMLLALGAAIWLNTKYLPSSTKYLGEATYVDSKDDTESVVEASAKVEESDYFTTAKKDREAAKKEAEETVTELLKSDNLSETEKKQVLAKIERLGTNIEKESNIETLLSAKGFKESLAVIGEKGISIIVKSEGLTSAETLQIQDIVTNETDISLSNIKIIPVVK